MKQPFLQVKNLSHSFAGTAVLEDISFSVEKGEFIALVGQSGLGKTTLLRILSGLIIPTCGEVIFEDIKPQCSYVFQTPSLLLWKNVLENVLLPLEITKKKSTRHDIQKATALLDAVELTNKINAFPAELSEGQKQRVSLARALISEPQLMLLDEPFGNLDAMTRERLHRILYKLWKTTKTTIVFVTHSISEAVVLAEKIIVLEGFPAHIHEIITVPQKDEQDLLFASEKISHLVTTIRKKILYLWEKPAPDTVEKNLAQPEHMRYYYGVSLGVFLLILLVVDMLRSVLGIPTYLWPSLQEVWYVFIALLDKKIFYSAVGSTIITAVFGFAYAFPFTLLLGYICAKSRWFSRLFMPYVLALQVIPVIAYAPLLIIWFGLGLVTKVYTAALIAFFPMLMNTIAGLRSLDPSLVDLQKLFKATRWQSFWFFEFPSALPFILSGAKVGLTFSLVGAVVGEFLGGNQGIGHLIAVFRSNLNTAGVVLCMGILLAIGSFFQVSIILCEKGILQKRKV